MFQEECLERRNIDISPGHFVYYSALVTLLSAMNHLVLPPQDVLYLHALFNSAGKILWSFYRVLRASALDGLVRAKKKWFKL